MQNIFSSAHEKNVGVAGYAEAFYHVQSGKQASDLEIIALVRCCINFNEF